MKPETCPLASTLLSEAAAATKTLYVLHGIFGSGRNWSSVIRRFVRASPQWQARLVDLRQHGASQGFAPPHTLEAAARDVAELAKQNEPAHAILGHSFGGKVALMCARECVDQLEQVWVVDSTPEARTPDGSAWHMLELIRRVPREFASRDELVQLLIRFRIPAPTAQWMATNLERAPASGRYRWRFDFDAIEQLLRDFFKQDLWSVLENPPGNTTIHLVKAQQSSVLSPAAVQRVENIGRQNGRVFLHDVAGGHWVNADNPDALLALLTSHL